MICDVRLISSNFKIVKPDIFFCIFTINYFCKIQRSLEYLSIDSWVRTWWSIKKIAYIEQIQGLERKIKKSISLTWFEKN